MSNPFFQNRQLYSVGSFKEKKPCNTNNQKKNQHKNAYHKHFWEEILS